MKEVKINNSMYINPFLAYSLFWIISLFLYSVSPSKLNVSLDSGLLIFIIVTVLISFVFSIIFYIKIKNSIFKIKKVNIPKFIVVCLILFYIIEFIYSKNIPLLSVITGSQINAAYTFGIPTIHVIGVTFNSFFCIYCFFQFILFKEKNNLIYFMMSLSYNLLIYSRGMLMFVGLCCVLLFLISMRKISVKTYIFLVIFMLVGMWLFGVLGNLRVGSKWNDSSVILELNKIEKNKYGFFSPLYWVEQYFTVSIRNLNFNLDKFKYFDFEGLLYSTNLDFISKRLFPNVSIEYDLAAEGMTTGTAYIYPYITGGYFGMFLNFTIYLIVGILILIVRFKDNCCKLIALAILFFCFALTIFDNMLLYSGYSFSLVFCILFSVFLPIISKCKINKCV